MQAEEWPADVKRRRNVLFPGRLIEMERALILEAMALIAAAAVLLYVMFGPS